MADDNNQNTSPGPNPMARAILGFGVGVMLGTLVGLLMESALIGGSMGLGLGLIFGSVLSSGGQRSTGSTTPPNDDPEAEA